MERQQEIRRLTNEGEIMTDTADDGSLGSRVDSAVENLRVEVNARIDAVQATVDELSAKVDAAQGQTPPEAPPEAAQTPAP
jgi:hypothetical protein